MKKLILILFSFLYLTTYAQNGNLIGEYKNRIRNELQSNPANKLCMGKNSDTVFYNRGMQTIYLYKKNRCCSYITILPSKYKDLFAGEVRIKSFKKINNNTWVDSNRTIKIVVIENKSKGVYSVITTGLNK